jgi:hypothetical protein
MSPGMPAASKVRAISIISGAQRAASAGRRLMFASARLNSWAWLDWSSATSGSSRPLRSAVTRAAVSSALVPLVIDA